AARECGNYVVNYWDELEDMQPAQRGDAVRQSYAKLWYGHAIRGTAIHEYAQQLLAGQEIQVPEDHDGHVNSYLQFVEEWQPRELLVETPIFSREFQYAGTVDLVADLADNRRWLLDMKTSKSEPYPEVALQLAAYRYADFALID